MSMLSFMPWCRIDKPYDVGDIKLLPFERHNPIEGLDDAAQCHINTILGSYKTIEGKPIDRGAIVRYGRKSLTDDLSEEERDTIYEFVTLACFCGLARHEYFNSLGPYCNSDCFTLYTQKFERGDFTTLTTRRREGQTSSLWRIDAIVITIPVHCHFVEEVTLDESLLKAFADHRHESTDKEWGKWENAITCFNQANTDSENIRHQVEWVLLCSAFQHLLRAKSNAKDVASKFSEAMVPSDPILTSGRSGTWTDNGKALRYEWMREFYQIRGDFAHGKLKTEQPTVWNTREHLLLATIAFPLVVKRLLNKACRYELTDADRAQIDSFEALADTKDFLRPPPDQENSLDSYWKRLCDDRRSKLAWKEFGKAWEECKSEGLILDKPDEENSKGGDSAGESA